MTALTKSATLPTSRPPLLWAAVADLMEGIGAEPDTETFADYRFDPTAYIVDKLGWEPWSGTDAQPGQQQVIDAYTLALRQQLERRDYEAGTLAAEDLQWWQPGEVIQNRIRVEAGNTTGKTRTASGLVNHFFDCFVPSIIYTFAPSWEQIHDLLWKEIKGTRRGKGLPGRILDLALDRGDDHFAKGRATNDAAGQGTERVQGQHGEYLMFVLDEAEGIADYVYDAVDSMTSGGISIVLLLANPRTRTSRFHKAASAPNVVNFRISSLWHPNVVQGREIVPGAVQRHYVDGMLDKHCELVPEHDEDRQTFEVPWRPGEIFVPDAEMLFRVLGEAPTNMADNTLIPLGRYEAACARQAVSERPTRARLGVDMARYGQDLGTLYVRHDGAVWREAQFPQQDTHAYVAKIRACAERLHGQGVTDLQIRVDGGGGFGSGVIDSLKADLDLLKLFAQYRVLEVQFGGTPTDEDAYADVATAMYGDAAEALKALAIRSAPDTLEADLCERTYDWATRGGVSVKRLTPKEKFKAVKKRSPDDGDGFVLAVAEDHVFQPARRRGAVA